MPHAKQIVLYFLLACVGCDAPPAVDAGPLMDAAAHDAGTGDSGRSDAAASCADDPARCVPGMSDTVTCGQCGSENRLCTDSCEWEGSGVCVDEGECAPGETRLDPADCPVGEERELRCSDDCVFEPSAPCMAEVCDSPGSIEQVACGLCGTRERFCQSDGFWRTEACVGEGTCTPGTARRTDCGNCGSQEELCTDSCEWIVGSECEDVGECVPGTTMSAQAGCPTGSAQPFVCNDQCTFVENGVCRAALEVFFLIDTTTSYWRDFEPEIATFRARCLEPLAALEQTRVGLVYYEDWPPPRSGGRYTLSSELPLGSTPSAIEQRLLATSDAGGSRDSTMEALAILSGASPSLAGTSTSFVCPPGTVSGACWRPGSTRWVVMFTDEHAMSGPDPTSDALYDPWPDPPTWLDVRPAMLSSGVSLSVFVDHLTSALAITQYQEMVADLGQRTADVVEGTSDDIGPGCDAIITRIRTSSGR